MIASYFFSASTIVSESNVNNGFLKKEELLDQILKIDFKQIENLYEATQHKKDFKLNVLKMDNNFISKDVIIGQAQDLSLHIPYNNVCL